MNKIKARRIHAHFEASTRMAIVLPVMLFMALIVLEWTYADALAVFAAAVAFCGMGAAIAVDTISKRIPNPLNLLVFCAVPVWWASYFLGSDIPAQIQDGAFMDIMGRLYGYDMSGAFLPLFEGISYPKRILLDEAMMFVVLVPLFLSFALGLGFGGGDVKLMASLSLFFGWPIGMDFFFITFLIGGIFSVAVVLGRISSKYAIKAGLETEKLIKMSNTREFPFAPAIGIAAVFCFAIKLQGLN